ncbi:MAG: TetR family transcriptional regulator [Deltaproteobacteria bacterium]|nr:TetR family transcriptional regulator [Deltaproteobacteria bacterium]
MTKAARPSPALPRATPRASAPVRSADDERVLEAAAAQFKLQGYAATSVREIARAAGMLPGSLHYRYPSKEALLVALMELAIDRVTAAVRKAVSASNDPAERLRLGLRAHLRLLLSGDASFHVLLYDQRSLEPAAQEPMRQQIARYESFWDGLLFEAAGAGLARPDVDITLVRQFGFGAVNWVAQWWTKGSGRTPDQIADAFWAALAFGVLAEDRRPDDTDAAVRALLAGKSLALRGARAAGRSTTARTKRSKASASRRTQRRR